MRGTLLELTILKLRKIPCLDLGCHFGTLLSCWRVGFKTLKGQYQQCKSSSMWQNTTCFPKEVCLLPFKYDLKWSTESEDAGIKSFIF